MRKLLVALLFALPLFGQDAASIALGDADPIAAIRSPNALTRATAARVVMVRGTADAIPALREALAVEKDAVAAREQVRALVLLGSDDDVAFAASQLPRFPASIDGDFAEAVGRVGAPRATSLYLQHVAGSRNPVPAAHLALWGRTAQATGTAARLLGAKDERAFRAVLQAAATGALIETGVLGAALASDSNAIVNDTIWYLVDAYAGDPAKFPEELRASATGSREGASIEEAFGRELLRRMLGAKPVEQTDVLEWLKSDQGRITDEDDVRRLLTNAEQTAIAHEVPSKKWPKPVHLPREVAEPEFVLPVRLPPGLADAILKATRCNALWIGMARATVDRAGRVQTLDAGDIGATPGCQRALESMLRLSLAEPQQITAPLESARLLAVKPAGRWGCFDDDPVDDSVAERGTLRVGGRIKAPVVRKRVNPNVPEGVRIQMQGPAVLVVQAIVGRNGCVRDLRLVEQSPWPELNSAALLALSHWRFEPGTLDGVPVDVLFNLTINFRSR